MVMMGKLRTRFIPINATVHQHANGIYFQQVSLVTNALPKQQENRIHLIGRAGHSGHKSVTINFVTNPDVDTTQDIQDYYNTNPDKMRTNTFEVFDVFFFSFLLSIHYLPVYFVHFQFQKMDCRRSFQFCNKIISYP